MRGTRHSEEQIIQKDRDPKILTKYEDLSFRYIFDATIDAEGHAEPMRGTPAKSYYVKANIKSVPDFADPEETHMADPTARGRLTRWL